MFSVPRPIVRITIVMAVLCALVGSVPSASAHAVLIATSPANEATLKTGPSQVTLTFSENVKVAFGGLRVYAPDGSRVDNGKAKSQGDEVRIPIHVDASGTYAASWRVISADTHPVQGAFTFNVTHRSGGSAKADAAAASKTSRVDEIGFGIARFLVLGGALVAVGSVFFALFISTPPMLRPRLILFGLIVVIVGAAAAMVLDAATAGGFTILDATRWGVLRQELQVTYGRVSFVRIVLAALCAISVPLLQRVVASGRRLLRVLACAPYLALTLSLSLSGHAIATHPVWLRLPADMAHATAATVWLGGLIALALMLLADAPTDDVATTARRYSLVALTCVSVLVITGAYAAFAEIGWSKDALLETTYGRLVVVKVLLVIALLPVANLNRTRHVPGLHIPAGGPESRLALRKFVLVEVAVVFLVLAATAWLIETQPAKSALKPQLQQQTLKISGGETIQVTVDPAGSGPNVVHAYVYKPSGLPDPSAQSLTLSATNKTAGIGPLTYTLLNAGPGHFTINGAQLPQPGIWKFVAHLTRGKFDQNDVNFTMDIRRSATS